MTTGAIKGRLGKLEAATSGADTAALVIYRADETTDQSIARVLGPAGRERKRTLYLLPDNGRDPEDANGA